MRTVAIVQARVGSTRLPGKSAMLLQGKPIVWHVLSRVRDAWRQIVLAVPAEQDSAPLVDAADSLDIPTIVVGGDPNDLAHRYHMAAKTVGADVVIRVPADNPCVDPDEIKRIVGTFKSDPPRWNWLTSNLDRNIQDNGYPGGIGAEVYDARYFKWLDINAHNPRLREHPHLWATEDNRVFTCQCPEAIRRPDLRFDLNTQEDFDFIADIYEALYPINPDFRTRDILAYLEGQNGKRRNSESADHRCSGSSGSYQPDQDSKDSLDRGGSRQNDHAQG